MQPEEIKKIEDKVSEFWESNQIFKKSLQQREKAERFVFFEGPPTANGQPGIHHVLARAFKDIICRYKTMRGYFVLRKAGWDTHGLPVEIQVEKELGLKNKKEIEEYGIAEFNKKARASVWKYKSEWERMTKRMGFWIDMDDPYITYDPKYIESLWWILRQLWDKKLLYQGHKVVPFCTRCGTPLSSHEVAQGYKETTDTSVYVKFKVKAKDHDNMYLLAWTTTPWTLPGNVALAVGKNIEYWAVSFKNEIYILAKDLVEKLFGSEFQKLNTFRGEDLVGMEYESLFDVPKLESRSSYQVYPADFVTTKDGTGIVHTAVMYGEDDYELGKKVGLPTHHTVDEQGKFTSDVERFAGQYVKDPQTEKGIIKYLEEKNSLLKIEPHTHDYPFCWRCGTPLLYYAKESWFIGMSRLRGELQKNNEKINWVPNHIKEGRFGEFLKEAKDWALSRERYWGTPLPIWKCSDCGNLETIGAYEDLDKKRYRPKNRYFLIRHGLSEKNATNGHGEIIASRADSDVYDLTAEGMIQVKKAAADLKRRTGNIDAIFTSPLIRAKHTAETISKEFGVKIIDDNRLLEIDHGSLCQGKSVCLNPEERRGYDGKHLDGESWHDVKRRVANFIKDIESKYEGKNIVIVSHAAPLWFFQGIAELLPSNKTELSDEGGRVVVEMFPYAIFREVSVKNLPYNEDGEVDPHRPYIDAVYLKCSKCGKQMKRVKDLIDVWFDSGAMPYAQWHYPFENKEMVDKSLFSKAKQFPADYITEAIDQTRGWFYTLLAISTALGKGNPYKNVICLSHINDEKGQKMSKSKGNIILPDEVMDRVGADIARWYFYTVSSPGEPKSLSFKDLDTKFHGFLGTFYNVLRFFELYSGSVDKIIPYEQINKENAIDDWINAELQNTIKKVTELLEKYDVTFAARCLEDFVVNDLSNWWIRRSRRRFQRPKDKNELTNAVSLLHGILLELSKMFAPFIPYTAEYTFMALKSGKVSSEESIHLASWPVASKLPAESVDLGRSMQDLRNLVAEGLAVRKAKNLKVRQPLSQVSFKYDKKFGPDLEILVKDELNVKSVVYAKDQTEKVVFDENLSEALILEGYAREIQRQIQDMRKEAKYKIDQAVQCFWDSDNAKIKELFSIYGSDVAKDTMLASLKQGRDQSMTYDVEKEFDLDGQKVWLGVKK